MHDDDLSPEQRQRLADLGSGLHPPADLEDRVVGELRRQGFIRQVRASRWGWVAAAAAAVFAFALGRGLERPLPAVAGEQFLLMLVEDTANPVDPAVEAARVREYRAWAGSLAQAGRLVTGQKLEDRARSVGSFAPLSEAEHVTGFFIVIADDLDDAERIARECPHFEVGRIEVRPIDPTG